MRLNFFKFKRIHFMPSMARRSQISNQRGQSSIEMVLMTVVIVAVAIGVSTAFRSNEFFANLVNKPWDSMAGLIQNGVMMPADAGMAWHPSGQRMNSPQGEALK